MFGLVVAQEDLMTLEINSLPSDVVAVNLTYRCLDSYIPKVNRTVPTPAGYDVVIIGVPFQAEYPIIMLA